jgi:hypothetical protein
MLYKLVLVIAIASCLLMPVIAFARGGHWRPRARRQLQKQLQYRLPWRGLVLAPDDPGICLDLQAVTQSALE